jgi:hypothetical protein
MDTVLSWELMLKSCAQSRDRGGVAHRLFDLGHPRSFFDIADVHVGLSLAITVGFLALCMAFVSWFFLTGYRLKN